VSGEHRELTPRFHSSERPPIHEMMRHTGIGHHLRVSFEVIGAEAAKQERVGGELRDLKNASFHQPLSPFGSFGTRRLGRSGLAHSPPLVTQPPATDNVWDVDCSSFFPASVSGTDIHGAYFTQPGTIELMRQILRGIDRGVLKTTGQLDGDQWPR
jgi:hypothetical protein